MLNKSESNRFYTTQLHETSSVLRLYMHHLKDYHSLRQNSEFKCLQNSCGQSFPNLDSFRKHIKNELKKQNFNISEPIELHKTQDQNIENAQNKYYHPSIRKLVVQLTNENTNIPSSEIIPPIPQGRNEFNLGKLQKQLHDNVLNCLLSFHSNNNFTRTDVINIQENI